jgi:hypothetical protein
MSTKAAKDFARKARKAAPASAYDFARNFERAIEALADELEALKLGEGGQVAGKLEKVRERAKW